MDHPTRRLDPAGALIEQPTRSLGEPATGMRHGRCPQCGGAEIHLIAHGPANPDGVRLGATAFSTAWVNEYVCVGCGYLERYVADPDKLAGVAAKFPRVLPE